MIDFCSGVTYALGGSMDKVADQVFLLTPSNVEVSPGREAPASGARPVPLLSGPYFVCMHTALHVLYYLGQLYVIVLIIRALMSWFPYSPDSPLNPVRRVAFTLSPNRCWRRFAASSHPSAGSTSRSWWRSSSVEVIVN